MKKLSFKEFLKKYQYMKTDEVVAYELYLIVNYLKELTINEKKKNCSKCYEQNNCCKRKLRDNGFRVSISDCIWND